MPCGGRKTYPGIRYSVVIFIFSFGPMWFNTELERSVLLSFRRREGCRILHHVNFYSLFTFPGIGNVLGNRLELLPK